MLIILHRNCRQICSDLLVQLSCWYTLMRLVVRCHTHPVHITCMTCTHSSFKIPVSHRNCCNGLLPPDFHNLYTHFAALNRCSNLSLKFVIPGTFGNYPAFFVSLSGHNTKTCSVKLMHGTSLLVLDMVYLNFETIYQQIAHHLDALQQQQHSSHAPVTTTLTWHATPDLSVLRSDFMLLAVIVTSTAAVLVDAENSMHVS